MALQRPAKPPGPDNPCAFESHRLRLSNEPVAQTDESASLRSLRSHVRVVPGSLQSGVVQREDACLWNRRRGFESFPRSCSEKSCWCGVTANARRRERRGLKARVGSIPSSSIPAGVVQMADTPSSEGGFCEFESHLPYQFKRSARSPTAEAAGLIPAL